MNKYKVTILGEGAIFMIVVTNTIKVEKGFADQVIERFTGKLGDGAPTKDIAEVPGFLGFELWKNNDPALDYEEVVVTSKWENDEAQRNWVKSEAFKRAHGRSKEVKQQKEQRKGIHGNHVTRYEIVHIQEPINK